MALYMWRVVGGMPAVSYSVPSPLLGCLKGGPNRTYRECARIVRRVTHSRHGVNVPSAAYFRIPGS